MDYALYLAQLNAGYLAAKHGSPYSSCMSELWQQGYNEYMQLKAEFDADQ
jgi:hypothetical protein